MFGLRTNYSAEKNSERKAYLAPILYIPVPQTGHLPFIAGLPFFIVTFSGFSTSLFARHLTQYIETAILNSPPLGNIIQTKTRLTTDTDKTSAQIAKGE